MRVVGNIAGLEMLFDLSPDLLCIFDDTARFLSVNKALLHTLGYTENELLEKSFLNFIHPEDKKSTLQQLELLSKDKIVNLFINRYYCANGSYKWLSWNANRLPDGTFYASARDITVYKNTQLELEKAVDTNQKIFDNSVDILCIFDPQGNFIKVGKAAETVWGYTESELLGKNSFDIVHPEDHEKTCNIEFEIRNGQNITNFENRVIHKNGSVVPMIWSATCLNEEKIMFAIAHDATNRKRQKEQIEFREQRFEGLIKNANDLIIILDENGFYKFVSPSVKKIFHTEPEFYLDKNSFDFIHPEDLKWLAAEFKQVLETENPVYIRPFRFFAENGNWIWIETIATNRLNDAAISGIIINAKDVTAKLKIEEEKKLATESLRLSNERYQLASEATNDVIWDWDLETNKLCRNVCFEKLFGHATPESPFVESPSWDTFIFPEDKNEVMESIGTALDDPEAKFWRAEYRYLKANGLVAFIIDQGYIIRNETKKAIRMVGAMQDVTELKEKKLRIMKQNEQLKEIAQINSHETRRPVATILGLIEIFDQSCLTSEEDIKWFKLLKKTTYELDEVIKRINSKAVI